MTLVLFQSMILTWYHSYTVVTHTAGGSLPFPNLNSSNMTLTDAGRGDGGSVVFWDVLHFFLNLRLYHPLYSARPVLAVIGLIQCLVFFFAVTFDISISICTPQVFGLSRALHPTSRVCLLQRHLWLHIVLQTRWLNVPSKRRWTLQ